MIETQFVLRSSSDVRSGECSGFVVHFLVNYIRESPHNIFIKGLFQWPSHCFDRLVGLVVKVTASRAVITIIIIIIIIIIIAFKCAI